MKGGLVTTDRTKFIFGLLRRLGERGVLVGVPASDSTREDDELSNAMIGYLNEKGSPARGIPARPHLIRGVRAASEKTSKFLAEAVLAQTEEERTIALEKVGLVAVSSVKNIIASSDGLAPLKRATIIERRRAGATGERPLLRTGQYLQAITYVVE